MITRRLLTATLASLPLTACQSAQGQAQIRSSRPRGPVETGGRFARGFDATEAATLIELCGDLNERGTPGLVWNTTAWTPVMPARASEDGYPIGPWQNAWKLWRKADAPDTFAVAIRGTIIHAGSVAQNIIATALSARPVVMKAWNDGYLAFPLAETEGADAHLGFAYGLAVLMFARERGILRVLRQSVPAGSRIYLTGHSQGGAIASLAHAFLHYAINDPADLYALRDRDWSLKSYVYAQPRPGNTRLARDFERIASGRGVAFVINNTLDWVTRMPPDLSPGNAARAEGVDGLGLALGVLQGMLQGSTTARDMGAWVRDSVTEPALQMWNQMGNQLDPAFRLPLSPFHPEPGPFEYAPMGRVVQLLGQGSDPIEQHLPHTYRALIRAQLG